MAVSKSLRHQIMRRDNHTCRYCGAQAPDVKLTIDHVTPQTLGGQDVPENLVAACVDCNAGKSATPPDAALVADVDQRAVEWAHAMQVVTDRRLVELEADRKRINRFDRKWRVYRTYGEPYPRDANWRNSVARFLANGLDDRFLADAAETAIGRPRMPADEAWNYFCGICWKEVRSLQAAASDLMKVPSGPARNTRPLAEDEEAITEFPFMEFGNQFLEDLLDALRVDDQVRKVALRAFWDAIPTAAGVFDNGHSDYDGVTDEDGFELTRFEMAQDFMGSSNAHDMYEIGQLLKEGGAT
jgi:hypothetical protein